MRPKFCSEFSKASKAKAKVNACVGGCKFRAHPQPAMTFYCHNTWLSSSHDFMCMPLEHPNVIGFKVSYLSTLFKQV